MVWNVFIVLQNNKGSSWENPDCQKKNCAGTKPVKFDFFVVTKNKKKGTLREMHPYMVNKFVQQTIKKTNEM